MEVKYNPFRETVNVTIRGKWIPLNDLATIFLYHLKVAGIDIQSTDGAIKVMMLINSMGFTETQLETGLVRIREVWYESI